MKKSLVWAAGCCLLFSCTNSSNAPGTKDTTSAMSAAPATPPQSEFADARYTEIGKKVMSQLASGDIKGMMDEYADNAVYNWSAGDSLAGKGAIEKYWMDRRANVVDSLSFAKDIWLPLKVNRPQQGPDVPGVWLLNWTEVHVKYKKGPRLVFWVHTDYHFDQADKIDRQITYIDRAPINKATGMH
ncbi:MAG: hypothetical protein JST42_00945 [Bacteroidetes bacterium]|nr:hypothetical protein [Bacteroidota bacterium]